MRRLKASSLIALGLGLLALTAPAPLLTYQGDATGWNNAQKIVVDAQGRVHLAFQYSLIPAQDEDLFVYARSTGQDWEIEDQKGRWPTLAYDGSAVWLAYVERTEGGDRLWLVQASTLERWLIAESVPHSLFYPALAAHDGSVYLAWEVHREGKSAIMLAEFAADRAGMVSLDKVAENDVGLYFPTLAVGPDGPHLAYEEAQGRAHGIMHAWRGGEGWQYEIISGAVPEARYPALDYDPEKRLYELVFVGYSAAGNTIYYRAGRARDWTTPLALTAGLEPGYWTFPVVEDGLVVWGRTVTAGCSIGPLYYCYPREGCAPRRLEGNFAAFPHLFRRGDIWHLVWTDRDPESPLRRVIRYRNLRLEFNP